MLLLCFAVRRSSTKKSDYFTKRYSQPQLDTGVELSYPPPPPPPSPPPPSSSSKLSQSQQYTTKPQIVNPVQNSFIDVKACDLETVVAGNNRAPHFNRRNPIHRFSCDNLTDDYHSSSGNTVTFGDRCTFGGADVNFFAGNKMQSSNSVSSSSSMAQNRRLIENDGNESAAFVTIPVDLTIDNLPAVDTPDACDKAALR